MQPGQRNWGRWEQTQAGGRGGSRRPAAPRHAWQSGRKPPPHAPGSQSRSASHSPELLPHRSPGSLAAEALASQAGGADVLLPPGQVQQLLDGPGGRAGSLWKPSQTPLSRGGASLKRNPGTGQAQPAPAEEAFARRLALFFPPRSTQSHTSGDEGNAAQTEGFLQPPLRTQLASTWALSLAWLLLRQN